MPLFEIGRCQKVMQDYRSIKVDRLIESRIQRLLPQYVQDCRRFERTAGSKELLMKSLKKYDRTTMRMSLLQRQDQILLNKAIRAAETHFRLPLKIDRLDWRDVLRHLEKGTSSGYPHYCKKGTILETILEEGHFLGHWAKRKEFNEMVWPYATAFKRSHLSPVGEPKLRLIWVLPAAVQMIEGLFAPRLIEAFGTYNKSICFKGHFSTRIISALGSFRFDDVLFNLDWSGFDTSISPRLIYAAFDILKSNVNFDTWDGIENSVEQKTKWNRLWDNMVKYFINTPIIGPDGMAYRKTHGIPSGSWFTQLVGSIVNWILIKFMLLRILRPHYEDYEGIVNDIKIYVLGDDSLFGVRKDVAQKVDLDMLKSIAAEVLQMKLNPDKSKMGSQDDVKFLGFYVRNGHLYKDEVDYLCMMLYPESNNLGPNHTITRAIGIYITSGGFSSAVCTILEDLINTWGFHFEMEDARHMIRRMKLIWDFDIEAVFSTKLFKPIVILGLS